MKTKLLFAGLCLFFSGTLLAASFTPTFYYSGCNSHLKVTITSSGTYTVTVHRANFGGIQNVINVDPQASIGDPADFIVNNDVPGTFWIKIDEIGGSGTDNNYISIALPCIVRQIRAIKLEFPDKYHGKVMNPEESDEEVSKDLEVQWKLEELDPETFEPVYTIDNPPCWHQYNTYNGENAFNGFDGYNLSSVDELNAGACSEDEGTFNKDKIYRITRSYYTPENDWISTSVMIGPGFEEVEEEPEARGVSATAIKGPSETETELFTLAQIRENGIVQFNTSTDDGTLEVYDVAGNKMSTIALQNESFIYQLSVSGFAKGVYVVRMESGRQISTRKFIVD